MPPKSKNKTTTSSPSKPKDGPIVIYWHRTDLRLHDSPALAAALALNPSVFIPIWTWDPHYVYRARVGPNRWKFLTECQSDLSKSYAELNPKQKLWLIREAPQTVFPKLFPKWKATHLVFEKDTDAYARSRDEEVIKIAQEAGVEVIVKMGRTLFDPDELVKQNGGKPTMSMAQVQKACEKTGTGEPDRPVETPKSIPDPLSKEDMDLSSLDHDVPEIQPDFNASHRGGKEGQYVSIMGPKKDFAVPTLEEMGIDPSTAMTPHRGGETVALEKLKKYITNSDYVGTFEKPKTSPADFSPQSTTLLSPHLHFGSLSVRKYWWDVQDVISQRKKASKQCSSTPVNLPGQLLFRDMYFGAQAALGYSFAQTQGNKIARFVDWDLQSTYSSTPLGEHLLDGSYTVNSSEAEIWFRRWKHGQTGFPWIDALMRQLKQEGWIHHLGRHSVACFLTRGGCYVSWERGAEVFEEWLVDHETACNVGNWMWLSCTAFFSQFYRCYSPIAFGRKWDPEGLFVKRYCPELVNFDKKYVYEPWKAPIADQKTWGCLVRGDGTEAQGEGGIKVYPKPMFDFDQRRNFCIEGMKKAYKMGLYGNDRRVMDGSWKKSFKFDDEGAEVRDETNGMVERPKKRKKVDAEGAVHNAHDINDKHRATDEMIEEEEGEGQAGEQGEERPAQKKQEREKKSSGGKKQGTLDAHLGKTRGKR